LALPPAGGALVGALQEGHRDVLAREVDHLRVAGFVQFQRPAAFAQHGARRADDPEACGRAYGDVVGHRVTTQNDAVAASSHLPAAGCTRGARILTVVAW